MLVTGGAGFIGSNLCIRATQAPRVTRVVALDDLSTGSAENLQSAPATELQVGSILDGDLVDKLVQDSDVVIHLAAVPSVPRSVDDPVTSFNVNVTGTHQILEACRRHQRPLVLASSSSVYGHNPTLPKVETLEPLPASPYAAHKLSGEVMALAYLRTYRLPVLALRFFNVYGPNQAPEHAYAAVVPTFLARALRGEPVTVYGDGEQSRDFTFIDSVVDVLLEASLNCVSHDGPVNLAFGTRTTLNELLRLLEGVLERPIQANYEAARQSDVRHSQANHDRLSALFPTIEPRPLQVGLARTAEWMARHLGIAGPAGPRS